MKRLTVMIIPVLFLFLISCDLFDPEGNNVPEWYPSTWTYSESEMSEFSSRYSVFVNSYNVSDARIDIDTLGAHLFDFFYRNVTQLCTFNTGVEQELEFDTELKSFFNQWWRIFSAEQFEIDSSHISISSRNGDVSGRFYPKNNYNYPLNDPLWDLGQLRAKVDSNGYLFDLWSTLIPQLPIPDEPIIDINEAKYIIDGYTFTLNAWPQIIEHTLSLDDIESSEMVVYIENNSQNRFGYIKYRLVWRFRVQDGYICVDAITGENLEFHQTTIYM